MSRVRAVLARSISTVMASSDRQPPNAVAGVRLSTAAAGIKAAAGSSTDLRTDLVLIEAQAGSSVAAVFTRNRFEAAPVTLARRHLAARSDGQATYLLINSGNANAGTGEQGMQAALASCAEVAAQAAVEQANVLPFSTGVIGEQLPAARITAAVPELLANLDGDCWSDAARAIMTTDTVPKQDSVSFEVFGRQYLLTGISKGAGMIMPNMATMLCYMATDLTVDEPVLQSLLDDAANASFNRITVDGDTSTNDACVLIAAGTDQSHRLTIEHVAEIDVLRRALNTLSLSLAQQIIEDAEGATKLVTVKVSGGHSNHDCLAVAYTIAHSPLVKTALYACDPNWGRVLAAVGRAPIDSLDVDSVSIYLDAVLIAENGAVSPNYNEADASAVMVQPAYTLQVDLGAGEYTQTIWTCDLSHDYVSINADYRS